MRWIETYGGNLVCLEKHLLGSWMGNEASSIGGHETDYARAGNVSTYTSLIPVAGGTALVISSGPQESAVWKNPFGFTTIVSVEYSEPDIDELSILKTVPCDFFADALKTDFAIATGQLVLFDSVDAGCDASHAQITFSIDPGQYEILSKVFSPTTNASFILHRFQQK